MSKHEQIPLEDLLDTCLHGQSPLERDEARTALIRHHDPTRIPLLLRFLDAPQRLIRRRAIRLLGDIDPRVVRRYIKSFFVDPSANPRVSVALARMLTSQTKTNEPLLAEGLQHQNVRIRQACATRAAPLEALTVAISDTEPAVRNKAAAALLDLEAKLEAKDVEEMCAVLTQDDEFCQRLLFRCIPDHPRLASIEVADACALDYSQNPQRIEAHPTASEVEKAWALSRLSKCTEAHAVASDARIRQAYTRSRNAERHILERLATDPDAATQWMAKQAISGAFGAERLAARCLPHERLKVPSAQPPFGIRAEDERVGRVRVHAGLALCHGRLDVNIGVAVRSAEAAGFSHVFVVGDRPLMKTAMRGTDSVVSLHMVPDGPALVRAARVQGFQLVAVQQTPDSQPYHLTDYPPRPLFLMGAEDMGLPDSLRHAADLAVEIPMFGEIDSLNVATAATTVMFHWRLHGAPIFVEEEAPCT